MKLKHASLLGPAILSAFSQADCTGGANEPEPKGCSQMAAGLQACPGSAVVQGIDVSVYQGTITWPQVKSAGRDFAFARVSDGVGFVDSEFAHNWQGMKAAGVVRGAYQYFRAGQDPVGEADLVAASLRDAGGLSGADLPIVMDIETADGQSAAVVRANMATWLGAIARATGKTPIIYTNSDTSALIGVEFGAYALWVANWAVRCPVMPAGWPRWAFWQYSDRGAVPGIAGAVDLDELDGTLSRLAAFGAPPTDEGGVAEEGGGDSAPGGAGVGEAGADPAAAAQRRPPRGPTVDAGSAMGGGTSVAGMAPAPCRP